ncbi:hypothetical protein ACIBP6_29855 [Nonomuraea terrae]|uniref:hypothetical protein n=1 Tax=Nonomuraea terrae TaxID=2530383 RepID=UPI0037B970F5
MAKPIFASWAHGVSAEVEPPHDPAGHDVPMQPVLKTGGGVTFTIPANTGVWVHMPVASPVHIPQNGEKRAQVGKVMLLFDARQTSSLMQIKVHDGASPVWDSWEALGKKDIAVSGEHLRLGDVNSFFPGDKDVHVGINIAARFAGGEIDSAVYIAGFGADFVYPQ